MPTIKHKTKNEGNTMNFAEIKRRIANPNERRYYDKTYAVHNEYGVVAIVYADCEQNALDEALDGGKLDSMLMSAEDFAEYEQKGWHDSYMLLGNASEPVWTDYLGINEINRG